MITRAVCPFCQTAFDWDHATLVKRAVCIRCGEPFPVLGTSVAAMTTTPPATATSAASSPFKLLPWSLGLTLLIVLGFGFWWWNAKPKKPVTTSPTERAKPPATLPPAMLPGLKHLPRDVEVIASLQPSPLWQYAERTGQNPYALLEDFGLPRSVFEGLGEVGLAPDKLAHITVGATLSELPPRLAIVLTLREPLRDPARLRQKLDAIVKDPNHRDIWTVQLPNVPLYTFSMTNADANTYVLYSREADVELARKPHGGLNEFSIGVRESIARLSPASWCWLATESQDWANVKSLEVAAKLFDKPDLLTSVQGLRAVAVGVSMEPELTVNVSVRSMDADAAAAKTEAFRKRIADPTATIATSGTWTTAMLPFEPPAEKWRLFKKWIE